MGDSESFGTAIHCNTLIIGRIDGSQILFPCRGKSILIDHTSLSHCVAGMLQFLEKYLLLDILRPTSRIGSLALTNTGSHPCMCQEGESLNQLTLMVPLKKKMIA